MTFFLSLVMLGQLTYACIPVLVVFLTITCCLKMHAQFEYAYQYEKSFRLFKGICFGMDEMPLVVLPYMKHGDLLSYVRDEHNVSFTNNYLQIYQRQKVNY